MATGRVQAGFFYTRTRLAGLSQKPRPGPFIKRIFFLNPKPASSGLRRPRPLIEEEIKEEIFKDLNEIKSHI